MRSKQFKRKMCWFMRGWGTALIVAIGVVAIHFCAPAMRPVSQAYASELPTTSFTVVTKNDNQSNAQTGTTLWTPATGKRFIIMGGYVSSVAAQTTVFKVGTTTVLPIIYSPASGICWFGGSYWPIYVSAADAVLTYTTTANTATSIFVWGYEDSF